MELSFLETLHRKKIHFYFLFLCLSTVFKRQALPGLQFVATAGLVNAASVLACRRSSRCCGENDVKNLKSDKEE